ncbi:MAG TPA: LapA family protein [Nocardioidaceae bacterium]|jgi:uncharacterized integral membrane protein
MSARRADTRAPAPPAPTKSSWVNGRTIGGLVVAALLVVWILFNRQDVHVSLVFGTVTMPLWVALTVAAVLGALVGFVAGRRRYRR